MKKINYLLGVQTLCLTLLISLCSLDIKAQTTHNPVLTWDKEVGCIDFDDRQNKEYYTLIESIIEEVCLKVCEFSTVKYELSGNNIAQVNWQVTGGSLITSNNSSASIKWGASGSGSIALNIIYSDSTQEIFSVCIEKIISPKALFVVKGVEGEQKKFCTHLPILFENLSNDNGGTAIVNYFWDFGDGTTSNAFEPTHTYDEPGVYRVILIVTNSCNCSSGYALNIIVEDAPEFEITCVSVVCFNEKHEHTYSVNDGCGGQWIVEGGYIIGDDLGTHVNVIWDNVDVEQGFGYLNYQSKCSCPYWTRVKVPVILPNAKIKGPDVICLGSQGKFSLPQWPTTEFTWMINGNPNHPMLVHTDQHNEIIVDGAQPGVYTLIVEYRNTLIDGGKCNGYSETTFKIEEVSKIITDTETSICQNEIGKFETHNHSSVKWKVLSGNSVLHTSVGNILTYEFVNPGSHLVTADHNGCSVDPVIVNVIAKPVITGNISGPEKVCLNTPYIYMLSENESTFNYIWNANNGNVLGNNVGTQAELMFTSSPASIFVQKQIVKNGKTCSSEPLVFNVSEIVVNPEIVNNSGLSQFCPSSTASFSLNLGDVEPDHIEWSIASSTENSNFGNILMGMHEDTVSVSFNEISSSPTGVLKVKVVKCGVEYFKTFTVNLILSPILSLEELGGICPGDGSISLNLNTTPALTEQIMVSFNDGTPQGPYLFSSGSPTEITNGFVNNTTENITQTITIMLSQCNYSVSVSQSVTVFPLTQVDISPGYSYVVCPTNYEPFTLNASISTGITSSVVFEWFKNGAYTGASAPTYTVSGNNPGGSYFVRVKDQNNCQVRSAYARVVEDCNGNPDGCIVSPDPNVNISGRWDMNSCDKIIADLTFDYAPTSITWLASQHLSLNPNTQNTPNAEFTTSVPGVHIVEAQLHYGDCMIIETITIKKHYNPILQTAITCNDDGTYKVILLNNSQIFDIDINDITFTYSGSGITGNPTGQSYTLNNVLPGNYIYTLTLSSADKPDCSVSVPVSIEPNPNPDFTISPIDYCSEDTLKLFIPNYNPNYQYKWKFNQTGFVASNENTYIQIDKTGESEIYLAITTPYGCIYESVNSVIVNINKAKFNLGDIEPDPADFCLSSAIPLSYSAVSSQSTLSNINWMQDNIELHYGMNFQPTQSGSYWPVLIDSYGCKFYDMSKNARSYVLRQAPFTSISGNTSLCYGESTVLYGITTDNSVEHRWSGPSLPSGFNNWVTGAENKELSLSGLSPGTYNYAFHTRTPNDTSCSNSFSVSVVAHPKLITPSISLSIHCEPYTLELTASGPTTGTYNWSNGMSGQTIQVYHGGAYSVSYTESNGCSAKAQIQAPHNLERALWVVPSGCYTACSCDYLLGPFGVYEDYDWLINSSVSQDISTPGIPNHPIYSGGSYQFVIKSPCLLKSNTPDIVLDIKNCPPKPCDFKFNFEINKIIPGGIIYFVTIHNPTSSPLPVHLTSYNGFGTFVPSTFILNPGSNSFGVFFSINGTYYPGAVDLFVISGKHCADILSVELPKITKNKNFNELYSTLATQDTYDVGHLSIDDSNRQTIYVQPNPTSGIVNVMSEKKLYSYTVYNMQGSKLQSGIFDASNQINLQNESDAVYFINITCIDGNNFTVKVIKE